MTKLPLAGVKVLELSGLAPSPFAGMILADFGASVTRVGRPGDTGALDWMARGKRSICVDLKKTEGRDVLKRLSQISDVLIEPYRVGVMESLGLGPSTLCGDNKRLVYVRMNGYGTTGCLAKRAGHDINYLAISGVLSRLGESGGKPSPPVNLLGDFAGGSFNAVMGIIMALFERTTSGEGQVVESSITEGSAYVSSFLHRSQHAYLWMGGRGESLLDGGAPYYQTYRTKDIKFIALGAIEPQFYKKFLEKLQVDDEKYQLLQNQMDVSKWPEMTQLLTDIFSTKTRDQWTLLYENVDACVTPVLEMEEAASHPHNIDNHTFMLNPRHNFHEPAPAPKLSRTPAVNEVRADPKAGEHTVECLLEEGLFTSSEVDGLLENRVVQQYQSTSKL